MDMFGELILRVMRERGLNLTQLAEKAGMDKRNVQKMKDKELWKPTDLVAYGKALGVDLFLLLTSEETKSRAAAATAEAEAREHRLKMRIAELEKERDGLKQETEMLNLRIEVMKEG
jgi:lambda repressor-like predicted transcriptional regulator